jgi:hypothetical protein
VICKYTFTLFTNERSEYIRGHVRGEVSQTKVSGD